jgi:hypothetical protein
VLEMPSGTGKTVSLLSLIVSYQQVYSPLSLSINHYYRLMLCQVPPHPPEVDLLFAYSTGNRESTGGVEKVDGIPNIMCRHSGGEGKRIKLYGTGTDQPKEPLHTS